ncbi:MAG: metal-dependent hydrolase [Myxococcota bacterium]
MEPVTQALLGAATAEWVAGKSLGRGRALGWGAIIGMSPDLDVLLGSLQNGYGEWLYHRGTSHSLWFGFAVGPLLGFALHKWRDPENETPLRAWIALAVIALVTHPLLDAFTPYGTQFFAPFDRTRIAWNGVAIVDPAYSAMLAFGVFAAGFSSFSAKRKRLFLGGSLVLSTLYLLIGVGVHHAVTQDLEDVLRADAEKAGQSLRIERVRAYPTIFQPWLRSFVARTDQGVYAGLHSWPEWDCPSWQVHPAPAASPEAQEMLSTWEGRLLDWFADGDLGAFVTPAATPGGPETIRLEDLRYAWASAGARGMWGLEAPFQAGQRAGPLLRTPRPNPSADDARRLLRLLQGKLPAAENGWHRPAHCLGQAR